VETLVSIRARRRAAGSLARIAPQTWSSRCEKGIYIPPNCVSLAGFNNEVRQLKRELDEIGSDAGGRSRETAGSSAWKQSVVNLSAAVLTDLMHHGLTQATPPPRPLH
jgi:hypothetical protein